MSKASPTFQDASERLELVFNAVAEIARGCDLDTARLLLVALQSDDERYGKIIAESLDKLAAVSDGPIKWKHGRGVRRDCPLPEDGLSARMVKRPRSSVSTFTACAGVI